MSISLVEVAGANFRTDEQSDALNTAFMGRLGMRKRYLPARLAIARSLAISVPPDLGGDELEPGKSIKGDTLFGTGTALSVWLALIIERAGEPDVDTRRLVALVGAHWRRGLASLDKEWEHAGQDVAKFVKRLVEVAELPTGGRGRVGGAAGAVSGATYSSGLIDVPIGEIGEDAATKEKVVWSLNGRGGSPHSALMGGVGSGKTRTAVAMLRAIRGQAQVPLLAFDFKGDLGTDASGGGYHIDELFEAKTLEPPAGANSARCSVSHIKKRDRYCGGGIPIPRVVRPSQGEPTGGSTAHRSARSGKLGAPKRKPLRAAPYTGCADERVCGTRDEGGRGGLHDAGDLPVPSVSADLQPCRVFPAVLDHKAAAECRRR